MFEIAMLAFTVVSACVRTAVFMINVAGRFADPLPPDQGPQVPRVSSVRSVNEGWEPLHTTDDEGLLRSLVVVSRQGAQGSGVCIDPRGYVLTVRHVVSQGDLKVTFSDGLEVSGRVIKSSQGGFDGATLIKLDNDLQRGGYPFTPVATSLPVKGEGVTVAGTHKGNRLVLQSTLSTSHNLLMFDSTGAKMYQIDVGVLPGLSGGAVWNSRGEVVSLVVSVDKSSLANAHGLSLTAIQQAALAVPPLAKQDAESSDKPDLEVWTMQGCPPCDKWKRDFAEGTEYGRKLDALYTVRICAVEKFPDQAKKRGVTKFPTFLVPSEDKMIVGYYHRTPNDFLLELMLPAEEAEGAESKEPAAVPDAPSETSDRSDGPAEVEPEPESRSIKQRIVDATIGAFATFLMVCYGHWRAYVAEQSFFKRKAMNKAERKAKRKLSGAIAANPIASKAAGIVNPYLRRE